MIPRSMSLLPGKDLVCGECGERWPFEPAGDPWATPPRQPVQASDDPIDEDALDAVWERWGDSQD